MLEALAPRLALSIAESRSNRPQYTMVDILKLSLGATNRPLIKQDAAQAAGAI